MEDSRRQFLKKLGVVSLFGVGAGGAMTGVLQELVPVKAQEIDAHRPPKQKIRYGMLVKMGKCVEGCNDCMDACHEEHNVPTFDNPKDELKWVWKESYEHVFPDSNQQFVPERIAEKPVFTVCNHCANPPCVPVCPVKATYKREDGIVDMDFHRCIGCRFCMAACPYGSRSFNWRNPREGIASLNYNYPTREQGVVEKCNFCVERVTRGQQPRCVETCKEKALVFGNLYDTESEVRQELRKHHTMVRKPQLGTEPSVFYSFEEGDD